MREEKSEILKIEGEGVLFVIQEKEEFLIQEKK